MTWGDRFEEGLVHLGDYPDDGETLTQEEFLNGTMRGQDAHSSAVPVSMSAKGPRAEKPSIEHIAQPGPEYWSFRCLRCGRPVDEHPSALRLLGRSVGSLLTAVLRALVGRGAWSRKTARDRATRPRSR